MKNQSSKRNRKWLESSDKIKMLVPKVRTRWETDWGYVKSIVLMLTYGIIEELLEEAIAWGITALAAKALSIVVIITLTGVIKVSAKNSMKGLIVLLKPVVKKFTYEQGNDKTTKLVSFFRRIFRMDNKENKKVDVKGFFVKLFAYLKRNVKTNTATISNIISSLGAGALTTGGFIVGGVQVPQWSTYVIGAIVTVIMFVLTQLGVNGKGLETQEQYDKRKENEAAAKAVKRAEKEKAKAEKQEKEAIKKQLEVEEQAQEEAKKELLKQEQEAEAKKQEAERNAKIAQIKAEYQAAVARGEFSGTLIEYLNRK